MNFTHLAPVCDKSGPQTNTCSVCYNLGAVVVGLGLKLCLV